MGKKQKAAAPPAKPAGGMAIAVGWPVYEVLISSGWEQEGALTSILVARRSPRSGKVAAASFLVDLACLGVKSAQAMLFKDSAEYAAGLRAHILRLMPMAPSNIDLAAKIVGAGRQYAAGLGFSPDPVFAQARHLLEGARPADDPTPVRTGGREGKPFFINGPNDDVGQVLAQLRRAVGEGNYHYLIGNAPAGLGLPGAEALAVGEDGQLIEHGDSVQIIDHEPDREGAAPA